MARPRSVIASARRRKRRARVKSYSIWATAGAFLLAALFLAAGFLSHVSEFAIADVAVEGTQTVASTAVLSTVEQELLGNRGLLFSKRNKFLYPEGKIKAAVIADHPRIKQVHIAAQPDNTLFVEVSERQPALLWCTAGECRLMDETGVVFDHAPETPSGGMFEIVSSSTKAVVLGEKPLSDEQFDRIQTLRRGIEEAGFTPTSFALSEDKTGVFHTTGPRIRIPADLSAEQLIENLLTVTSVLPPEKELEYIDLRFGDHVPYYPQ